MRRDSFLQAVWRVNRKWPLILAGLLVLNLAIYLVPFRILSRQADALQRDYILLQAAERRPSHEQQTPAEVYAQGVRDMRKFKASIPHHKELSGLVEELFNLAEKANLSIRQVNYDSSPDKKLKFLHYKVSFQVSGNYTQVKKLVHLIEQSKRPMIINELSLDGASSEKGVSLRLQLTTYFRTDDHEPAT